MKKLFKIFACGMTVISAAMFTGCSSDDEPFDMMSQSDVMTRSGERDVAHIITFEEGTPRVLAGPTSYGANLYSNYTPASARYTVYNYIYSTGERFSCGLNNIGGLNFYNGGIALSQWNIMSNPTDTTGITKPSGPLAQDWWYSYNNQCSVYNSKSTDGSNQGAGAAGSNTFAVIYGYQDSYNTSYMSKPYFTLSSPKNVSSMYICNSSYAYGVMKYGNKFGNTGTAVSLESAKGWFKVTATGYRQDGTTQTVERYLCDYRDGSSTYKTLSTTWEEWRLGLTNVVKVEFNFEGSDTGAYGLNTPAYLCIDNITIN